MRRTFVGAMSAVLATLLLAGCLSPASQSSPAAVTQASGAPVASELIAPVAPGTRPQVVATTDVLGDVVKQIGGNDIELTVLMSVGQDPHNYEPLPRDLATIERADIVFIVGLGLEGSLESIIKATAGGKSVVEVSGGIPTRQGGAEADHESSAGDVHAVDPHVWFNPRYVKIWGQNVAQALGAADPDHAGAYAGRAQGYALLLDELDAELATMFAQLPAERRNLVTDHDSLGYFADRYGFRVVGMVIPSVTTQVEPSARELAGLVEVIRTEQVPAVFVGAGLNPNLARTVASEANVQVLEIYTGALGRPDSGAEDYLSMMRTNARTIVEGLSQ